MPQVAREGGDGRQRQLDKVELCCCPPANCLVGVGSPSAFVMVGWPTQLLYNGLARVGSVVPHRVNNKKKNGL